MLIKMLLTEKESKTIPLPRPSCCVWSTTQHPRASCPWSKGLEEKGEWLGSGSALQICPGWAKPRSQLRGLHEDQQHEVT